MKSYELSPFLLTKKGSASLRFFATGRTAPILAVSTSIPAMEINSYSFSISLISVLVNSALSVIEKAGGRIPPAFMPIQDYATCAR